MVITVASLENGTYQKEHGGEDSIEMSVEELTQSMIMGKSTPKTREEVEKKRYYIEEGPVDLTRWNRLKNKQDSK
jgi:hypothetical protein